MKNIFLLISLTVAMSVKAQYVTVTDTPFVNWLKTHGYAQCFNGLQLDTTCNTMLNTTYLKCGPVIYYGAFHNLDGIQYFKNLDSLDCSDDSLVEIISFPQKLLWLICGSNFLTTLPKLPNYLKYLTCPSNQLVSLPTLPPNLNSLECEVNSITSLPTLPNSLTYLDCSFDSIYELPQLPDSMQYLICNFNPNLACLPYLTKIYDINFSSTNVQCIPNYGNIAHSLPPLDVFPLCDSINPNACATYTGVTNINISSFTLHPNPATNKIFCNVTQLQPNTCMQVLGLDGRLIKSIPMVKESIEVDVSMLSNGMYFLVLQNENGRVVKKFVKE